MGDSQLVYEKGGDDSRWPVARAFPPARLLTVIMMS